jgi:hypothetical protein
MNVSIPRLYLSYLTTALQQQQKLQAHPGTNLKSHSHAYPRTVRDAAYSLLTLLVASGST